MNGWVTDGFCPAPCSVCAIRGDIRHSIKHGVIGRLGNRVNIYSEQTSQQHPCIPNLEGSSLIARGYKPALNNGPSPLALTVLYHADGDQRNASLHIHQHFQLKGQVQVRRAMALGAIVRL